MLTYYDKNYYTYNELSASAKKNAEELFSNQFKDTYLTIEEDEPKYFNFTKLNNFLRENFDSYFCDITKLCFDIENHKITYATVSFNIFGLDYLLLLDESDRQYLIDKYNMDCYDSKDNIDCKKTMKIDFIDFTNHAQFFITNNFPQYNRQEELVAELLGLLNQSTPSIITKFNEVAKNQLQEMYNNEYENYMNEISSTPVCNSIDDYIQLGDDSILLFTEDGMHWGFHFTK